MVPLPSRSPGSRLQPVTVWCTSCCLKFQYMHAKLVRQMTAAAAAPAGRSDTSRRTSYEPYAGSRRYGSGVGSCVPALDAQRKGSSASNDTTHGDTDVAKFLAPNGPSGTYSHRCTSRADQSFTRQ